MWKLIKMDFYRLFTSKAIKLGAIVAGVVCSAYMLFSLGVVELSKYAAETDPEALEGLDFFLSSASWINGVNFSDIVLAGTSAFSLFIGCMIAASFIGSEQSSKYTKNFAGLLPDKGYMAVSKFVVTSAAQFMVLVIYTAVSCVFAMLLFGQYINGYDLPTLVAGLCLRLMLHLAINAVIIFICTLTKSHAVAMVFGCIFGIGVTRLAYYAINALLGMMKINIVIGNYMPDGINSELTLNTVSGIAVRAIVVSIVFIVIFVGANYAVLRKRDVK